MLTAPSCHAKESCKGFLEQKSAGRPGNWFWCPKTFRLFSTRSEKSHRICHRIFITKESERNADFRVQHKTLLLNPLRLSLSLVFLKAFPRLPPSFRTLLRSAPAKISSNSPRFNDGSNTIITRFSSSSLILPSPLMSNFLNADARASYRPSVSYGAMLTANCFSKVSKMMDPFLAKFLLRIFQPKLGRELQPWRDRNKKLHFLAKRVQFALSVRFESVRKWSHGWNSHGLYWDLWSSPRFCFLQITSTQNKTAKLDRPSLLGVGHGSPPWSHPQKCRVIFSKQVDVFDVVELSNHQRH